MILYFELSSFYQEIQKKKLKKTERKLAVCILWFEYKKLLLMGNDECEWQDH